MRKTGYVDKSSETQEGIFILTISLVSDILYS